MFFRFLIWGGVARASARRQQVRGGFRFSYFLAPTSQATQTLLHNWKRLLLEKQGVVSVSISSCSLLLRPQRRCFVFGTQANATQGLSQTKFEAPRSQKKLAEVQCESMGAAQWSQIGQKWVHVCIFNSLSANTDKNKEKNGQGVRRVYILLGAQIAKPNAYHAEKKPRARFTPHLRLLPDFFAAFSIDFSIDAFWATKCQPASASAVRPREAAEVFFCSFQPHRREIKRLLRQVKFSRVHSNSARRRGIKQPNKKNICSFFWVPGKQLSSCR